LQDPKKSWQPVSHEDCEALQVLFQPQQNPVGHLTLAVELYPQYWPSDITAATSDSVYEFRTFAAEKEAQTVTKRIAAKKRLSDMIWPNKKARGVMGRSEALGDRVAISSLL
jgi:hypothetical protein